MGPQRETLDFYREPAGMTDAGEHEPRLLELPDDVGAICRVIQGLVIHDYMAPQYGLRVSDRRRTESQIRLVSQIIDAILKLNDAPLRTARRPEERVVGVCHHFCLLLVATLRAKGIPARARCGFGSYFNPGYFEDHWLCEFWSSAERRWMLADPQFDDVWMKTLSIRHDILDVPRDKFLVGGDAWLSCRDGLADPLRFGIFKGDLRGLWFVAGDCVRDLAALNRVEMLPWDVWGVMPKPGDAIPTSKLPYLDEVASISRAPDEHFRKLRRGHQHDEGLRVPETVFNAVTNRPEPVQA